MAGASVDGLVNFLNEDVIWAVNTRAPRRPLVLELWLPFVVKHPVWQQWYKEATLFCVSPLSLPRAVQLSHSEG